MTLLETAHAPSGSSVILQHLGYVELPEHSKPEAFGAAAVHRARERVYVAHTANDALDVIDGSRQRYLYSLSSLTGVAAVLVSERRDLGFTANRGENSVAIFVPDQDRPPVKVPVGLGPSRLAYDPHRNILLTANAGEIGVPHSGTLSVVDVARKAVMVNLPLPGPPGEMQYNARVDTFYVNIVDPAQLVVVEAERPTQIARILMRPTPGPECPEMTTQRLHRFSACDPTKHPIIHPRTGEVVDVLDLGGVPDQIVRNPMLHHLYASFGSTGVLRVYDLDALKLLETVETEKDARAVAFYPQRRIFVLLPRTHRAAVYADTA